MQRRKGLPQHLHLLKYPDQELDRLFMRRPPIARAARAGIALQTTPRLLLGRSIIMLVIWTVILTELMKFSIVFVGDG